MSESEPTQNQNDGKKKKQSRRARSHVRARWFAKFIEVLSKAAIVTDAADAAGIHFTTAYQERSRNPEFRAAWEAALDRAKDRVRREVDRRAVEGWDEPVFGNLGPGQGAGEIGRKRVYSDRMLELRAKQLMPDEFRERWDGTLTGAGGGALLVAIVEAKPSDADGDGKVPE